MKPFLFLASLFFFCPPASAWDRLELHNVPISSYAYRYGSRAVAKAFRNSLHRRMMAYPEEQGEIGRSTFDFESIRLSIVCHQHEGIETEDSDVEWIGKRIAKILAVPRGKVIVSAFQVIENQNVRVKNSCHVFFQLDLYPMNHFSGFMQRTDSDDFDFYAERPQSNPEIIPWISSPRF